MGSTDATQVDWTAELVDQLDWHWRSQLRPLTAEGGLALLDQHDDAWVRGVRNLGPEDLARPCGPAEGPWADRSMAALVLHVSREVIHHGAEVCLLRDRYLRLGPGR